MANVTEAKVAPTPAPRARTRAKAVEAMVEATEVPPEVATPAPEPGIGMVAAEAAPAEQQAPVRETAAPQIGTTSTANPAHPMRMMTMEHTMEHATKAAEGFMKAAEEAAEFGRGNFEAMTKATQLYVAGVQDLGKQTLALVQGLADHTVAGAKAMGAVKSLKEAAEIQASYTRTAVEKSMADTAKLQEAALKLAEASFAPLSARMTLAVEKFSKPKLAA